MQDISPSSSPEPIRPFYSTPSANAPVRLHEGLMVFSRGAEQFRGNGEVSLEWLPSPRFRFQMRTARRPTDLKLALDLAWNIEGEKTTELEIVGLARNVAVSATAGHVSDSELEISGSFHGEIVTGADAGLSTIVFHLANVPPLCLSPERFVLRRGLGGRSWERVLLRCEQWTVTLDPVEDDDQLAQSAKASRGYAITRVGKLERNDGHSFSLLDARPVLEVVQYMLSFAFERWCPPMLLVGFDSAGERQCELWCPCRVGRYQVHRGWFDFHHPGSLSQLFPAMQSRWKDERFREALTDAIYWFIEIHQQPVHLETGVVLGQVTLEMLSWLLLVEKAPIVSEAGFEKLPSADKVKLLLSACLIPVAPPADLKLFSQVAKAENWQGPDGVVAVRNGIVHVNRKKREQSAKKQLRGDTLAECYNLVCWYIELVLLRQLGYMERYSNRLKQRIVGQTELVPWAQSAVN